jgi:hypothetical protein
MSAFLVVSYLSGAAAIAHAATRPSSAWVHADRQRGYWLTVLITLTLFALGIVAAIAYLVGVVPRFSGAMASENSPFIKR